jgi:hypothetical protein
MIIKLPHVEAIDTLNIPDDFEKRVYESFKKFTEMTSKDYTFEDKLMYLDNLRNFLHPGDAEQTVKNIILHNTEFQLDEYGDFPDKDDFFSLEFMCECFEAGNKKFRFMYENSSCNNDKTHKVIFEIIKIIVNWSETEEP